MEKLIANRIREILDERNWNYDHKEEVGCFLFGVRFSKFVPKPVRRLEYIVFVEEDSFTVITGITIEVDCNEEKEMVAMTNFLHKANFGRKKGCFEFDTDDGDIRFKFHVDCEDIVEPSKAMIENAIDIPAGMMSLYGKGIVGIIYAGYAAEEAIEKTEGKLSMEGRRRMLPEELEMSDKELDELTAKTKREIERVTSLQEAIDSVYKEFPEWDIYQESHFSSNDM